jgi:hypothetical protein
MDAEMARDPYALRQAARRQFARSTVETGDAPS